MQLISGAEYERAFYTACNSVYGTGGVSDAPAGVVATFESMKQHIDQVHEAGKALYQCIDKGNESAKFLLSEHEKAQEMSHFRSKEDASLFYSKVLGQSKEHEHSFLQNAILMERLSVFHDQNSRILLKLNKLSSGTIVPSTVTGIEGTASDARVLSKKFNGTKLQEECKTASREMVLRNPLYFMYCKSSKKFITRFVANKLCPIVGACDKEKVRIS